MKTSTTRNSLMTTVALLGMAVFPLSGAQEQVKATSSTAAANPDGSAPTAMQEKAMADNHQDAEMAKDAKEMPRFEDAKELIAAIQPASGSNVKGSVLFKKVSGGVEITARIGGLEPNSKHGIHIHEFGDITATDATSAGGHFNPEHHDHALPETAERHAGDLGNLVADEDGNATLSLTVENLSLTRGDHPIVGRAVIIHEKVDDGGQPTGNAGARIGAGVIGVSAPAEDSDTAMSR
ncbi:Cu-Zn family superoxide dismutase [Haloferula luteola]|uniref:Cu-Zn family superoxide dismutase n=1 Tax=Haloferula luteola TaxID=595692 RepID=A0A840V3S9_9BACT|nr:superoxide dismutase family protein [Haloferula luteola]MBB5351706.1 Cu-Zn family superoxide dismutase [Haloferula luteola]